MSAKEVWYGVLEAGSKTTPVVRDLSIQNDSTHIWLYNHSRNAFVQYSQEIVGSKLRELTQDDISKDELDKAFKNARKSFTATHKVSNWEDTPAPRPKASSAKNDDDDIDLGDEEGMEEFIDDDGDDD